MLGSEPSLRPSTWPTRRSVRQRVGSTLVPTPMSPPGTAYWRWFDSAKRDTTRERMGWHVMAPSLDLDTMPGRISTSSPTLSTPLKILPPATPPRRSSTSVPGLFTSKERMMMSLGEDVKSRTGTGIWLQMYSQITSMLYLSWAEMGMIGAPSATVPPTNFTICLYCSVAALSFTRSILFWRMTMCFRRMISIAAKCSEVCGCGQLSLPAIRSRAASMTAAPLSIVAIRMS
mmetsp:Transcript_2048/g.7423  ORF Transcript_2048/g.7423 Transcript_2048/m.7423 type:complete len:231 (-) Transcript_2048:484-1176(-)